KYHGFILSADANSSGRGTIGQIQAELWYYPIPLTLHTQKGEIITVKQAYSGEKRDYVAHKDYVKHNTAYVGETIRRAITKPKLETEKFIEFDKRARRIGYQVLRQQMVTAISTPMRD